MEKPQHFIDPVQFRKDLQVNPGDLQSAFYDQSGFYAHYATLAQKAQRQMARYKSKLELVEAQLDRKVRASIGSGKKPTDRSIEMQIRCTKAFQEAQDNYHDAMEIFNECRVAADAFMQRRDMIVQAAKAELEEKRGGPRVTSSFPQSTSDIESRVMKALGK